MTLALAQSIIDSQGKYNHALSIQYFVDWFAAGRFSTIDRAWDVGYSTRSALQSWRKRGTEDLQRTQDVINQKLDMEHRSGNGSLMRIAPIGLALWREPGEARRVAREQSRVTHPVLGCLEACEVYTLLVCTVLSSKFSFFFFSLSLLFIIFCLWFSFCGWFRPLFILFIYYYFFFFVLLLLFQIEFAFFFQG